MSLLLLLLLLLLALVVPLLPLLLLALVVVVMVAKALCCACAFRTLFCNTSHLKRSEPLLRCCVLPDAHRICSRLGAGSKPQSQNKYEGEFSQVR